MNKMNDCLLTVKDLSEYLHISENKIYRFIESKKIPHIRIGRCVRFSIPTIKQWMEETRIDKKEE